MRDQFSCSLAGTHKLFIAYTCCPKTETTENTFNVDALLELTHVFGSLRSAQWFIKMQPPIRLQESAPVRRRRRRLQPVFSVIVVAAAAVERYHLN